MLWLVPVTDAGSTFNDVKDTVPEIVLVFIWDHTMVALLIKVL